MFFSATRAQQRVLATYTVCPPHMRELESMLEEGTYIQSVLRQRITMLDLLEKYEACELQLFLCKVLFFFCTRNVSNGGIYAYSWIKYLNPIKEICLRKASNRFGF